MDSKILVRLEAVKIAAQLPGIGTHNIIPIATEVANFIKGKAKLPEVKDKEELIEKLFKTLPALPDLHNPNKSHTSEDLNES